MLHGNPLPGWTGRFFHSENMTFAYGDITTDAAPLHEHHHPQEEVWNIVAGEIAISIAGVEKVLGPATPRSSPPTRLTKRDR
jgi:mannose-6-phosphate isomerase-like protein (cupin superfamily)